MGFSPGLPQADLGVRGEVIHDIRAAKDRPQIAPEDIAAHEPRARLQRPGHVRPLPASQMVHDHDVGMGRDRIREVGPDEDRKSTRLNSSHITISYAVFCLKKKNLKTRTYTLYIKYRTRQRSDK